LSRFHFVSGLGEIALLQAEALACVLELGNVLFVR